jgi:hypothetical protein
MTWLGRRCLSCRTTSVISPEWYSPWMADLPARGSRMPLERGYVSEARA